jgi:S-adenosylmethionine hydrolase
MQVSGIVTFTTDFGTRDPYAGIMKGMILSANPDACIVDITHEIPAHDIVNASFTLVRTYHHFPEGTIHMVVVDPGVGGLRKNIAVLTDHYIFVGPDNGIFTMTLSKEKPREIRMIKNPPFVKTRISDTFHGRDVFAPCAGYLSAGKNFTGVGPPVKRLKSLTYPGVTREGNVLKGEVVTIDSFGNMITNISKHTFQSFAGKRKTEIFFGTERFNKVMNRYIDVPQGSPLVLFGSSGYLEISMNEGNASSYFMTSVGTPVSIRRY